MYSDFEKAFDKVPHTRLISKLHAYGLSNSLINWIKDFVKARRYRVMTNIYISHCGWHDVCSGIPQGSVLVLLLFLMYINDLIECCSDYSHIYIFADDAKLYRHISHPEDCKVLQQAINIWQNLFQKWLLSLNIQECHIVSFGRNVDKIWIYNICDSNDQSISLTRSEKVKDLAIWFNDRLIRNMQCWA